MLKSLYAVLAVVLLPAVGLAANLSGRVVNVHDGDTLTLLAEKQQIRIRLAEIDAPERKQAFGTRSRQSLHALCHGKDAVVSTAGKKHRDRIIGTVSCDGIDANAEQVRRGMAWVYDRYARPGSPLYALQEQARGAKAGLWVEAQQVAPWDWRKAKQEGKK